MLTVTATENSSSSNIKNGLFVITAGYISIHNTIMSDLTPLNQLAVATGVKGTSSASLTAVAHVVAGKYIKLQL